MQFDAEKREIVGNYERRVHYMRRLLEEYDENVNMLKLNLDAEKEQNFFLKTKVMELEGEKYKYNPSDDVVGQKGYLNECFDKDSCCSSPHTRKTNTPRKRNSLCEMNTLNKEKSSLDGLKYSDRIGSCGSLQDIDYSSSNTSVRTEFTDSSIHEICRNEFNRLLQELRYQQDRFDRQLKEEREIMKEQLENEKLQLERVVYKQLNIRLEREMKKQEFLLTENSHLRTAISNAIMGRIKAYDMPMKSPSKYTWKETNSDSGADVEDNRSDDDSDLSDSGKCSLNDHRLQAHRIDENHSLNKLIFSKLLKDPAFDFHLPRTNELSMLGPTHADCCDVTTAASKSDVENRHTDDWCIEITNFHNELKSKLEVLQEMFAN